MVLPCLIEETFCISIAVRAEEGRKGCKYCSKVAYKINSTCAGHLSGMLFLNSVKPLELSLSCLGGYCTVLGYARLVPGYVEGG